MKKLFVLLFLSLLTLSAQSEIKKNPDDGILRQASGIFDLQRNTVSNVEFYNTNYGIFGFNELTNKGGLHWPRGSGNEYIFGSGFWFGAQKYDSQFDSMKTFVELSYNPNNGRSWFVPGYIGESDTLNRNDSTKYRIYFSTDFNKSNGKVLKSEDGPDWPLWINDSLYRYQYGTIRNELVYDINNRNFQNYPLGPLFVSDEDILSTFIDTDLIYYDGGKEIRSAQGYPCKLQMEQRIYSWSSGDMRDVILLSYLIQNVSHDTLLNCYFGEISDPDLATDSLNQIGAYNDRFRYINEDSTLNLIAGWTNTDQGELGKGFGYIGFSLLASPAVDNEGFIRNDKFIFEKSEQVGLKTARCYDIADDPVGDFLRYNFISSGIKDGDRGPKDQRVLLGTGPFNMRPGDVARVVVALVFAMPAKGGEADGTFEDMTGLKGGADKGAKPGILAAKSSLVGKLVQATNHFYGIETPVNENPAVNEPAIGIYPNPAMNYATLRYNLASAGNVKLSVTDQLGQEVATIRNMWQEQGQHTEPFYFANNLLPGVYFVKLVTNDGTMTRKLIVTR